ncbi:LytR C-terminal domain-containing protein [Actinotalea sp. BY-33]|uniref:LytR C-terminal domain-containing protein n=1 Tax=Actinotalea soli TaxID=2819234 RepID=A0A939LX06_9CELL|nr:LytR C-terminal domain-containing protein [Actinotalea soli]MBO1752807.1 LytR C-terminal domain-containing protein [Actinotalea soli]
MAASPAERERALRRRRRHERQAVVFGSLVAALAIGGLGSAAVYTGAMTVPFLDRDFTTPSPTPTAESLPSPCVPEGTLPVGYAGIELQVLNGAGTAGLARTVATQLGDRGFEQIELGNYPGTYRGETQIQFGQAGLEAAYTLAAHLEAPVLQLDQREGPGVDLVVGTEYTSLLDPAVVDLDPTVPLESVPSCVPLEDALLTAPAPMVSTSDEGEEAEGEEPADDGAEGEG